MQDQLGGIEDMGPGRSKLRAVLHRWQSFETFDRIVDRRHGKLGACPGYRLLHHFSNFSLYIR